MLLKHDLIVLSLLFCPSLVLKVGEMRGNSVDTKDYMENCVPPFYFPLQ